MAVTVVFNRQQGCWYLIDRHPSHPNGRKAVKLGPAEADRLAGLEAAAHKNAEREAERLNAPRAPKAGAPIYGRDAFPAMLEATASLAGAPYRAGQLSTLKHHVMPAFRDRDLRTVTKGELADFARKVFATPRKRVGGTCGRATVESCMKLIELCFNWLKAQKVGFEPPVSGLQDLGRAVAKTSRVPAARQTVGAYTREEAAALLAELETFHPELRDFVFLALHTGARYGELVALEWSDLDLARGEISITKNIERITYETTTPKNGTRITFMGADVQDHLKQMHAARRLRFERVLLHSQGQPWSLGGANTAWQRFRKHAKAIGLRTLNFHCFRHTYVSWGIHAGVSYEYIANQIGDDVQVMKRNYKHWIRSEARRAAVDFMRAPEDAPVPLRRQR